MKLKKLDIRNLRMFEEASFEFDDQFTLLVGINAAGKTTVLGALRSCLSTILIGCTKGKYNQSISFSRDSLTYNKKFMLLNLEISSENTTSNLYMELNRRNSNGNKKSEKWENLSLAKKGWSVQFLNSDPIEKKFKKPESQPICVYFSTERAIISNSSNKKTDALFGQEAAYADALFEHSPSLPDMARWLHAQLNVSNEDSHSKVRTEALQKAITRFLPYCRNLQATGGDDATLTVEKYGHTIKVKRLSHGERSTLVLVLDIARRLSLANPAVKDPIRNGEGIVLIDEIDLHLHPKWQRKVAKNLCKTFPKCQFIAATHSPQVLGEVMPGQVQMLKIGKVGKVGNVGTPARSLGVDSNRILEDIMNAPPRSQSVERKVRRITKLVDDERREEALDAIEELEAFLGESDPETTRARTLLSFLE